MGDATWRELGRAVKRPRGLLSCLPRETRVMFNLRSIGGELYEQFDSKEERWKTYCTVEKFLEAMHSGCFGPGRRPYQLRIYDENGRVASEPPWHYELVVGTAKISEGSFEDHNIPLGADVIVIRVLDLRS